MRSMHSEHVVVKKLIILFGIITTFNAHLTISFSTIPKIQNIKKISTTKCNALSPVGPFCPFRSQATIDMDPKMETMNNATPEFAQEMTKIQLDMQLGEAPDPDQLRRVANGLNDAVDDWEQLLARLRLNPDFQTREYAKLTQAHLASHDQTVEEIASMMRWQSSCMLAMADNLPPPLPPSDLDMMKMMAEAQQAASSSSSRKTPSMTAMAGAEQITSTPFTGTESAFESETVKEEYQRLCRDHSKIIEMGASYANFDPMGKISYLDEIEKIEERWDIFMTRFSLLGQLNTDFVKQCNAFLESMGLDEEEFKRLLKETHEIMRKDAEEERSLPQP